MSDGVPCDADDCDDLITPGDQFIMVSRMVRKPDGGQDFVRGAYTRYHPKCHNPDAVESIDVDATIPMFPDHDPRENTRVSWSEAQERVHAFKEDMTAVVPIAGEGLVLYDKGRYGPDGRNSPPNLEVLTKAESVFDMRNELGAFTFRDLLERHDVEVLDEIDLRGSPSEATCKAYVGVPRGKISDPNDDQ